MEEDALGAERVVEDRMNGCNRAAEVRSIESDCHVDKVGVADGVSDGNALAGVLEGRRGAEGGMDGGDWTEGGSDGFGRGEGL